MKTIGYSSGLLEKRCTFRKRLLPYFGIKVGFERGDLCFSFCIQPEEIASSASIIQFHSIVKFLTKGTKSSAAETGNESLIISQKKAEIRQET